MKLDKPAANAFIGFYKQLLLFIAGEPSSNTGALEQLAAGRAKLVDDPSRLDRALSQSQLVADRATPELLHAVRNLQVKRWIYLRDTRTYSIFIAPENDAAFAVIGLTDRIRDILGGSGAFIETGVFTHRKRFVCDGLVSQVIRLGPGYKQSFNETLRDLRASGCFYRQSTGIVSSDHS